MLDIEAQKDVYVTMRDGVKLDVGIYKPKVQGQVPALLSLSPYGKEKQKYPGGVQSFIEAGDINYFVNAGYTPSPRWDGYSFHAPLELSPPVINTIYYDKRYFSYLFLPLIPAGASPAELCPEIDYKPLLQLDYVPSRKAS